MAMKSRWIIMLCLLGFIASVAHAGSDMKVNEGQWEITVQTEVVGMSMKMPASTYKQCIKKEQPVPQQDQPNQECKTTDFKISGNTVSWTTTCKTPGGDAVGSGKVTYEGDKMHGNMNMETQGMKMMTKLNGHRIGPCK